MIIVLGSIVATAITTLVMMVNMKGGTHFDPQVQEGNKSISSSFDRLAAGGGDIMVYSSYLPTEQKAHGFENGEHKIIIFVTCGILLLLVTIGFCLFSWGCCGFGGCRKYNRTIRKDFYTKQFYAHQCQVNDTIHQYETIQYEDLYTEQFYAQQRQVNDTIHQYETIQYKDEIEQIIILPVPTQFQDNEYGYKDTEEVTDCADDTDNTDDTEESIDDQTRDDRNSDLLLYYSTISLSLLLQIPPYQHTTIPP